MSEGRKRARGKKGRRRKLENKPDMWSDGTNRGAVCGGVFANISFCCRSPSLRRAAATRVYARLAVLGRGEAEHVPGKRDKEWCWEFKM